jgi:hypothetical protein
MEPCLSSTFIFAQPSKPEWAQDKNHINENIGALSLTIAK